MLDINFIREHADLVKQNNATRGARVDIDALIGIDNTRRRLIQEIEASRANLKEKSKHKPGEEERAQLRALGETITQKENELKTVQNALHDALIALPNINFASVPIGKSEADNIVEKFGGKKTALSFAPKPYFALPSVAPYLALDQGVRIAGSRFYYLTGKLAVLERALMNIVFDLVVKKGFTPVIPPMLVHERAMFGTGHFPADKNEIYAVNPGEDNLFLIGTSEVPLVSLHDEQTLAENELPKKYAAATTCFRREAGSYGRDQQGILRVHQFNKVEMVIFAHPQNSWKLFEEIVAIEEEIMDTFDLHYRLVNICSGELGYPAAQKKDIEAYFPAEGKYRELTSASNTTDFQSRRLHITYREGEERQLVHILNGTAVTDRALLAILEQYQRRDGSVALPKVLAKAAGIKVLTA